MREFEKKGSMMATFRRILVKLSGEALMAPDGYWLDPQTLSSLAEDLAQATRAGFEIAVVIGGGNIIRGARMSAAGWIDRPTAARRLTRIDRFRRAYVEDLYGVSVREPGVFHLVLDSTVLPLGDCVEIVAAAAAARARPR